VNLPSGIIIKGIGGFYYVKAENGIYECKARGIFRKDETIPLPGDRVIISVIEEEKKIGSLDEIMPRESHLIRPAVANVNQIAVVLAIKSPSPDFMLLDKLLITAESERLHVIICINKIDLCENLELEKILKAYNKTGYKIISLSSKKDYGFDELRAALDKRITVFAGQSGVGKSTILNRIMNYQVMQTGKVSEKIKRGKHTTRHAELVELVSGGYVVDTPGFSSFELMELNHENLELYYPEFDAYLNKCRFTGCSHISEPSCSIKEALSNGDISAERYQRYVELYNFLKHQESNIYKDSKHSIPKGQRK
jgi:ribosome biogenesis GTPase / thiamine phosphate phosphatase